MKGISSFCIFSVVLFSPFIKGDNGFCGMEEPEANKTCVEIQLPWHAKPIFFCDEDSQDVSYHEPNCDVKKCPPLSNNTVLINMPWSCCGHVSFIDPCLEKVCTPKPFNRTCTTYKYSEVQISGDGCCPFFNCDGEDPKKCTMKSIKGECPSMPKKEGYCIRFADPYGCCDKFQCKGEGKPGLCPAEAHYLRYVSDLNNTENNKEVTTLSPIDVDNGEGTKNSLKANRSLFLSSKRQAIYYRKKKYPVLKLPRYNAYVLHPEKACVSDYNCPGTMKCCSSYMAAYGDGTIITKQKYMMDLGACYEPIDEADVMKNE